MQNGLAEMGDKALARIVGRSRQIKAVKELIRHVAQFPDSPVIITGETGTGKELVADALHACGARAGKPLIKINCAAIPDALFESQFFGHTKGAFSGAERNQKGLVEAANMGALFLDEIGCLSLQHQAKLLRFAEDGTYRMVGGTNTRNSDVRLIAASNDNLQELVATGRFRPDLYYRLKALEINLPPLRERPDDLQPLVEHFLESLGENFDRGVSKPLSTLIEWPLSYDWPGNVRELKHAVERAFAQNPGEPMPSREEEPNGHAPLFFNQALTLEEIQKRYVEHIYKSTGYRKKHTARLLGIGLNTLKRKLDGACVQPGKLSF